MVIYLVTLSVVDTKTFYMLFLSFPQEKTKRLNRNYISIRLFTIINLLSLPPCLIL